MGRLSLPKKAIGFGIRAGDCDRQFFVSRISAVVLYRLVPQSMTESGAAINRPGNSRTRPQTYALPRREHWISGPLPPPFTAELTVSLAAAGLSKAQ